MFTPEEFASKNAMRSLCAALLNIRITSMQVSARYLRHWRQLRNSSWEKIWLEFVIACNSCTCYDRWQGIEGEYLWKYPREEWWGTIASKNPPFKCSRDTSIILLAYWGVINILLRLPDRLFKSLMCQVIWAVCFVLTVVSSPHMF